MLTKITTVNLGTDGRRLLYLLYLLYLLALLTTQSIWERMEDAYFHPAAGVYTRL